MTYKISFQLYSARNFPPLEAQLPALKEMGYDGVEPWLPNFENSAEHFRKLIDDAGLECYGFHMPFAGLVDEPDKYIEIAQAMGAQLMIPPYLTPEERPKSADGWKKIGEQLSKGAEKAARHGLQVAWHNHDFEFVKMADGSRPIDHILGAADNFGFEIDCAWVVRAGGDPAEELKRFAPRILAIQAKDTAPLGTKEEDGWAPAGDGIIDWPSLLPLFRETRADHIVTEHDNPADWKRFAKRSVDYLRGIIS